MTGWSGTEMTASGGTSQKSEIFALISGVSGSGPRATIIVGRIPIARSSRTECWVGFVFASPTGPTTGTSVVWTNAMCRSPSLVGELPERLEERHRFDVADGSADLDQHDLGAGRLGDLPDRPLDLPGDVRDDLDRVAEVVAAPLLLDDRPVDLARS